MPRPSPPATSRDPPDSPEPASRATEPPLVPGWVPEPAVTVTEPACEKPAPAAMFTSPEAPVPELPVASVSEPLESAVAEPVAISTSPLDWPLADDIDTEPLEPEPLEPLETATMRPPLPLAPRPAPSSSAPP